MGISQQRKTSKVMGGIGTGLSAMGGLLAATGVGAPFGAILGGLGGITSGIGTNINNQAEQRQAALQGTVAQNQDNGLSQMINGGIGMAGGAFAGMQKNPVDPATAVLANGGELNNNITQYQGNSHAQGGIQLPGAEVEGGETRGIGYTKDYVFSDRLKSGDKTFAEVSKGIEKKYEKLDNDRLAMESKNKELTNLKGDQELKKQQLFQAKLKSLAKNHPDMFAQMMQQQQQVQQQGQGMGQGNPQGQGLGLGPRDGSGMQQGQEVPQLAGGGEIPPPYIPKPMDLTTPEFTMPGITPLGINQQVSQKGLSGTPSTFSANETPRVANVGEVASYTGTPYEGQKFRFNDEQGSPDYWDNATESNLYGKQQYTRDNYGKLLSAYGMNDKAQDYLMNQGGMEAYYQDAFGDKDSFYYKPTVKKEFGDKYVQEEDFNFGPQHAFGFEGDMDNGRFKKWMEEKYPGWEGNDDSSIVPDTKNTPIPNVIKDPILEGSGSGATTENTGNALEGATNKSLNPLWSALPNVLQGLGSAALGLGLKYPRANTQIMDPDYVDPTRPAQEIKEQYANVKDKARQVSSGGGNYMSNLIGATAGESKGIASLYSQYAQANAGIHNQAEQFNAQSLNQGAKFNARLGMLEKQDKTGLYQNALEGIAAGGNNALNTYYQEKRAKEMLGVAGGENFKNYESPNGRTYRFTQNGFDYYLDPKTNKKVKIEKTKKV